MCIRDSEWRAYGYGFPSAGDRLGALRDGVEIFRQMWTTGSATHAGRYYTCLLYTSRCV